VHGDDAWLPPPMAISIPGLLVLAALTGTAGASTPFPLLHRSTVRTRRPRCASRWQFGSWLLSAEYPTTVAPTDDSSMRSMSSASRLIEPERSTITSAFVPRAVLENIRRSGSLMSREIKRGALPVTVAVLERPHLPVWATGRSGKCGFSCHHRP